VKSANRSLTPAQIRTALTSTAIDIETAGTDRDTGVGIIMAFEAVQSLVSRPDANQSYIDFDSQVVTPTSGDADAFLEPGEGGTINVKLTNDGAATATNINSTLTTSTPNVLITQGTSAYPNMASLTSANNTTPFAFKILPGAPCFLNINFTLTVTDSGPNSPRVFNFSVPTGQPAGTNSTVSYTGPAVAIPDNDETGIAATVNVAGFSGALADLNFRFDGSACSTDPASTTVGLNHSFVGDLVITLTSPHGTTITLRNSDANAGRNFCQTTLDDSAATSIQAAPSTSEPFTGTFKPAQALSTFNGEDPNGNWTLRIADVGPADTGSLRAFSLVLTPFQCDFHLPPRVSDFTGDGQADFSIFRPSEGNWITLNADNSVTTRQWGTSTDKPVPGDYDADGKTDYAVYRPEEGNWYVIRSSNNTAFVQGWGTSTDMPVPADYDNDGKTDVAVFRPAEGNWYIVKSTGGVTVQGWGALGDLPVQGDYDGDRKADVAVYRPSEGNWYVLKSTGGATVQNWGTSTDKLVPGDYDGDGKNDLAVFRPAEGNWYILKSGGGTITKGWGDSTDVLVPADYDNDGKTDIAVWRPSEANWYVLKSTGGSFTQYFGGSGDKPIPSVYLPQ
jgi:subtilisin-like proprotein convertase family protein